jgi:enamine deaminase RidA (YjgF/YER057c/UK114 family)
MPDANDAAGKVEYLQPEGLHRNPAYSDVVTVTGPAKTVYIGAQCAFDEDANLVGPGDIAAQTAQVLRNIDIALAAAGAAREHLIKLNIYIAQGHSMQEGFAAFQQQWGTLPHPPTNTVLTVAALVPDVCLVAIDAIAVVPLQG